MEKKILNLFAFNEKLKFNEIEKMIGERSNKLAYHIKQLIKKQVIEKQGEYYKITEIAEKLVPYFSDKTSPLVVILIKIGNSKECLLIKRKKRPFKDNLSLPGGRLLVNETIENAVNRIMKEKCKINAKLEKINSISLEFVRKNKKIIHSFILILVTAKTKEKIELINIEKNKSKITKSDYQLVISPDKEIKLKTFYTPA